MSPLKPKQMTDIGMSTEMFVTIYNPDFFFMTIVYPVRLTYYHQQVPYFVERSYLLPRCRHGYDFTYNSFIVL